MLSDFSAAIPFEDGIDETEVIVNSTTMIIELENPLQRTGFNFVIDIYEGKT